MTTAEIHANRVLPSTLNGYRLAPQARPRGLMGNVNLILLQPAVFFSGLRHVKDTRQWLWVALLIIGLVAFSTVQQETSNTSIGGIGGESAPVLDYGGEFPVDDFFGGMPPPQPSSGVTNTGSSTAATWTTALVAASGMLLIWIGQAVLLCEVSLFNGKKPRLGHNLQIAIWASLPLALMAMLQLLYQAAGGTIGEPGLSGLVSEFSLYHALPVFAQSLLLSLASTITLFGLWNLSLLYFGARYALDGKRWAILIVLVLWSAVLTVAPVLTGAVDAGMPVNVTTSGEEFYFDEGLGNDVFEGEFQDDSVTRPWPNAADIDADYAPPESESRSIEPNR